MRANAVILFAGDSRREESSKGLPPRFLGHLHARIASMVRSLDNVDVFIADEIAPGRDCLGTKVERVLDFAFDRGYERVVLLAADVAGLTREHLQSALYAGSAIGRSPDGGFYLLALTRRPRVNWLCVRWCGKHAFDDVVVALDEEDLALLPELEDIDTLRDALRILRAPRLTDLYCRLQSLLQHVFAVGYPQIRALDALRATGLRAPPTAWSAAAMPPL